MNGAADAVFWAGGGDRSGVYSLSRVNADLRRFDGVASSATAPVELSLRDHARPTALAALADTKLVNGENHSARTKKRSRTSKAMVSPGDTHDRVAVGMSDGSLVFLEGREDSLKERKAFKCFNAPVSCLAIDPANDRVWAMTTGQSKHLCVAWDWKAATQVARLKRAGASSTEGATRIAVSDDGLLLAVASSTIEIYSVSHAGELSLEHKLVGHASSVSCLEFVSGSHVLLSGCTLDRFVSMWNCSKDAPTSAVRTLHAHGTPVAIATIPTEETAASASIAVLGQDKQISVWNSCSIEKTADAQTQPTKPDLRVSCGAESDAISHMTFVSATQLKCFHGNDPRPAVEIVNCQDSAEVQLAAPTQAKPSGLETVASFRGDTAARIIDGASLPGGGEIVDPDSNSDEEQETAADNQTMSDRLASLGILPRRTSNEGEESGEKSMAANGGESVAILLAQAIRTKDGLLLEEALQSVSKRTAVVRTVQKIPVEVVPPLLDALVNRFQSRPRRAASLVLWIRVVVSEHLGVIVASSSATAALKKLRQSCEDRVYPFQKLMALQGRLDLVVSLMQPIEGDEGQVDMKPETEFVEEPSRAVDGATEESNIEMEGSEDE